MIYNQRPGRNKINTGQPLLRMGYKFEDLFSCQTNSVKKKNYERCFWCHLECDKKRKFKVLPRNRDNVVDLTRCSPHKKFSEPHVRDQSVCVHRRPKIHSLYTGRFYATNPNRRQPTGINYAVSSSRLSYMCDFTPVTNGVISSSRLSYMYDFTPVTNGVISSSRLCLYVRFYTSN